MITGAAQGLGFAYAETLAREGARVVLTDVNEQLGLAACAATGGSSFFHHDVRDESRWIEIVKNTSDHFGRLDVLVNNAGLVRFATIEDCSLEDYRYINAVMAEGTFLGCKITIPAIARGGGGSIINTSSVAAIRGKNLIPAYSAAKGAILALTRSVAAHCIESANKIRCNVLLPGSHETPMAASSRLALASLPAGSLGGLSHVTQGPAEGKPKDIANLVLFLASDESIGITGTSFVVDNGQTLK